MGLRLATLALVEAVAIAPGLQHFRISIQYFIDALKLLRLLAGTFREVDQHIVHRSRVGTGTDQHWLVTLCVVCEPMGQKTDWLELPEQIIQLAGLLTGIGVYQHTVAERHRFFCQPAGKLIAALAVFTAERVEIYLGHWLRAFAWTDIQPVDLQACLLRLSWRQNSMRCQRYRDAPIFAFQ